MLRKRPGIVIIFTLLYLVACHQEINVKDRYRVFNQSIDSIIQYHVDNDLIPGAVILIKKDGRIITDRAYGHAVKYTGENKESSRQEKMTTDHLFDIASLTKAVGTTTSIMLLAGKGIISPDDPAEKYLESFSSTEKNGITIRHLLTHTAGLYEWYPMYYKASDKEECHRLIGELPLKYSVGEQRRYSDLGFTVLGTLIEKISGQALDEYMSENIFGPLGMEHTFYNPLDHPGKERIAATSFGNPYEKRMVHDPSLGFSVEEVDPDSWNGWRKYMLQGEVNDGNAWYANGGVSGAAGLFSTAHDLQKIADMLMNGGRNGGKQFIPEAVIRTFLTKDQFNNGYGWMMDPSASFMRNAPEGSFGHTGFTGTSMVVIPDRKISVILLINRQNTGLSADGEYYNVNPLRRQIFETVMKYL